MVRLPLADTPRSFLRDAAERLEDFSIGFVQWEKTPQHNEGDPLGSGTLIQVGNTRAVLTACHVLDNLPKSGRVGLIVSRTAQPTSAEVAGLGYLPIARPAGAQRGGPDLAAVVLSAPISGSVAAQKSFINLVGQRELALNRAPSMDAGIWFVQGFAHELTKELANVAGYSVVKEFCNFNSAGAVDTAPAVGEHDYLVFHASYVNGQETPFHYGGTSGGGLWQVLGEMNSDGQLKPTSYLFSGVVFYKEEVVDQLRDLRCHGRRSVYEAAHSAILAAT